MDYTYTRANIDGIWNVDTATLAAAIDAALPGIPYTQDLDNVDVVVSFVPPLSAAQEALLDGAVATLIASFDPLPALKSRKMQNIDTRTEEIVSEGFVYSGATYSLSYRAHLNIFTLLQLHNAGALALPVQVSNADNTIVTSITSANIDAFLQAGLAAHRSAEASAIPIKIAVLAATTVAQLAAVVDNR